MEHITIRPASGQDAGTVFGFVKDLAEHHNAADMVTASAEDFQKMLDTSFPVFEALIAEDENGQAVGCALFFERFSTWKGPTIHIEDLMVDPAQRGKHIGEKLMDAVVDTGPPTRDHPHRTGRGGRQRRRDPLLPTKGV